MQQRLTSGWGLYPTVLAQIDRIYFPQDVILLARAGRPLTPTHTAVRRSSSGSDLK